MNREISQITKKAGYLAGEDTNSVLFAREIFPTYLRLVCKMACYLWSVITSPKTQEDFMILAGALKGPSRTMHAGTLSKFLELKFRADGNKFRLISWITK